MSTAGSKYMHWAKTEGPARFNLAGSGMAPVQLGELELSLGDMDLTGGGPYGYAPLIDAIASRYGIPPDCVVTANGASMGNHIAMAALIEHGDRVLIEQPTYEPLLSLASYLGADVQRFSRHEEDAYALDPNEIRKALTATTRLIVLTNLHNPTSAFADPSALSEVGNLARRSGAVVLVDEVYLDSAFEQNPHTAFTPGGEFVITSSLTKVYGLAGLRCGWVLANPDLAKRIWMLNNLFGVDSVHIAEQLSVSCFAQLGRLKRRSQELLAKNWDVYAQFLMNSPQLACPPIHSGTTSFPRLLNGSVDRLCAILADRFETSIVPGSMFEMPEHFRIGLGLPPEIFAGGLERISTALTLL